jgi:hypothetical protein
VPQPVGNRADIDPLRDHHGGKRVS